MAGTRTLTTTEPRSTAYYYADLERFRKRTNQDELSEYVETNEPINDVPIREVPPLRDRQWSLPEYSTPENSNANCKKGETYSTAGTFPMPETKEKEPLLAELEVVGRLPLTQLEPGVRRSRSWYLCCPNVGEEEISRESSWRYSSLRPVTTPPMPGQNGILIATQSSRPEDLTSLRAERDALARALAAERQRSANAARAHDARLAELHGVIAELVRRRAEEKQREIVEEEVSDECESTTQPAGELDNDADRSRTEQESSSVFSPEGGPVEKVELPDGDGIRPHIRVNKCAEQLSEENNCDTSLDLSERDSDASASAPRCEMGGEVASADSCRREHGSERRVYTLSTGRCESRQAKIASRVKLKTTDDCDKQGEDDVWCVEAAERLALDVCTQADLREAMLANEADGVCAVCVSRNFRLRADVAVLQRALARAQDTATRLYTACSVQEQACVAVCGALSAADRALEAYDVLLALAETDPHRATVPTDPHPDRPTVERAAAERVGLQLLARLDGEVLPGGIGDPLLSPGPWLTHHHHKMDTEPGVWTVEAEQRLRAHAARLKAATVAHRPTTPPALFSYHDIQIEELPKSMNTFNMADMEAVVLMQEVLAAREARAVREANSHTDKIKHESSRRKKQHWLHTQASETDL